MLNNELISYLPIIDKESIIWKNFDGLKYLFGVSTKVLILKQILSIVKHI